MVSPASATSELYAALPAISSQAVSFTATGSDSEIYRASFPSISFTAGYYYQSPIQLANPISTPLTLEALTAGTIVVSDPKSDMQFSLNGGAKTAVSSDAIPVSVGDRVAFYGNGTNISSYNGTKFYGGTAQVKVFGNIMILIDESGYATATMPSSTVWSTGTDGIPGGWTRVDY